MPKRELILPDDPSALRYVKVDHLKPNEDGRVFIIDKKAEILDKMKKNPFILLGLFKDQFIKILFDFMILFNLV